MEESSRSIADREEEAIRRAVIAQYIEYRKRKGITQQDIADSMGIKRPNIRDLRAEIIIRLLTC